MSESSVFQLDWRKWWVISYAVGLTLIPPIRYHDRLVFAAEWLLAPLIVAMVGLLIKRQVLKPPRALQFVWGACILTFVAGIFRGDLAAQISIYDLKAFKYFSIKDDGIVFLRMLIIFSTPWFLKNVLQEKRAQYFEIFISAFKISILISAILAILDQRALGLINLNSWGYFSSEYEFWSARARGTFNTPIDAGFMYGITAAYLITGPEPLIKNSRNLIVLIFSLIAMFLTHSGTAILGLLVSTCAFLSFERSFSKKDVLAGLVLVVIIGVVSSLVLPHNFWAHKSLDFLYRIKTYTNYLSVAPTSPWIFLVGIGFSRLCADNNFILLFIQGGILFFITVLKWFGDLALQAPKAFRFVFLFWVITWLSFDTMWYWGIGRFCWFLLGLF